MANELKYYCTKCAKEHLPGFKIHQKHQKYAGSKPPAEEKPAEPIVEPIPALIPKPSQVQLGSLPTTALFELNGRRYRVGEKTPECVVCNSLRWFDSGPLETDKGWTVDKTVSLGVSTMVKPIK